ncbi:MAG: DUF748 domain-containing protein [Deltaproteobacteria bacterium]|nr:DUF748 domain-containing protein [Deltaproteobacteria bacterium]
MSRAGRVGRVLLGVGVVLAALAVAAVLWLPRVARPLLERALGGALGTPVAIGRLDWQPRDGLVSAEQVVIGAAPAGLRAGRVLLQGDLGALWRGALVIDRLEVDAPAGTVELDEHYRPVLLAGDAGGPTRHPPPITLRRVAVTDGDLTLRYPVRGELRDAQVHVAQLEASDVSATGGNATLQGQLSGTLDGAPLEMTGRLHMVGDRIDLDARGSVSGLAVDRRTINLVPALDTFHAVVDLRGTLTLRSAPPARQVVLDVTLHEPRITDDAGTEFGAGTVVLPDVRIDLSRNAIELDRIAVDRPAGALQLDAQFRPTLAGFGGASSSAAGGAPPEVTIGELVITDGELALRYPVGGQQRTAPLHLARLTCTDIDLSEGRVALHATLDGALDGAPLTLTAQLRPGPDAGGPELDAALRLSDLSLDRTRLDLPAGAETLRTRLDLGATITTRNLPPQRSARLDLHLREPRLTSAGVAFAAKSATLPQVDVDLLQRRIDLGAVALDAPTIETALPDIAPPPAGATGTTPAWTVRSGAIEARAARVRLRRDDTVVPIAIASLRWGGLTPGSAQPLTLRATFDGGGALSVDGPLGLQPLDAGLDVRASALPLPALTRLLAVLPLRLARGRGDAALHVELRDGRQRVAGTASVADLHTLPPDPQRPAEVMAVSRAALQLVYDSGAAPPLDVTTLSLDYPYVMVLRRPDGTFPSSLLNTGGDGAVPRRPTARLREVQVAGGKLEFIDTVLEPDFWTSFGALSGEASDLRLPPAPGGAFSLTAKRDEISRVEISGAITDAGVQGRATLDDTMLSSFNPYVAPLLGFDVTAGWLSVVLQATPAGSQYDATAQLVLRGVEVSQVGEDAIQRQSGVPLPIALGLIADSSGTIDLTLPLAIDAGSGRVTLGSIVGQAVRSAIVGALTSPLRILGSLFGTQGAPHAFAIDPIPFPAGVGTLDAAGAARVAEITRILQAHPGLALVVMPQLSPSELALLSPSQAQALADARLAAVRAAFTAADAVPRLAADRLLPVAWRAPSGAPPNLPPSVYVELQDKP